MVRRKKTNATARRGTDRQDRLRLAVAGLKGVARFNAPLKEYTSFHIGGPADVLVEPVDTEDIVQLVRQAHAQFQPLRLREAECATFLGPAGIRRVSTLKWALPSLSRVPKAPRVSHGCFP
ncbi:MAG: hypothetical protein HP477_13650 [Nitrospira sp.]|nr:hypothetical protein [Nitrospira sp.]